MSTRHDIGREIAELKRRLYELERTTSSHEADEPLPLAGEIQAVVCRVEETRVALPLDVVERAVPAAAMAPLPEAPPWVHGLLNLRGRALPVLDVAARIERRARALDLDDHIVICRHEGKWIGLVVQEVLGVRTLALGERTNGPGGSLPIAPYVRATLRDPKGLVLLFSLSRLIATSDIPPLEERAEAENAGHEETPGR
ncbi:chemotaxis protein CheW [Polyangium jinanense]|uniref:Chemotaxis protein CheW n=1 Tax=Polyangium jinanense TaxID=2829994 RepID=A0A9X3X0L2_9BACT|nr:chemotaxis protein CheW [Polyangium jinanense]MDC3955253.1 chemotaxis protein CheW [Polyangium jinanense]MDC3981554.1 chemotaxis protein CheW [Polyangium jinanense]